MKIVAGFVSAVLAVTILAGCTATQSAQGNTAEPTSSVTTEAPADTSATTTTDGETKDYLQIGMDLMANEKLGSLYMGMTQTEVTQVLGEPDTKSDLELWGADGLEHTTWTYTAKGLSINLTVDPQTNEEAALFSIEAYAPCDMTTLRGIGIGATREDVLAAYTDEIDSQDESSSDDRIVIGTVYGGILVNLEDGVVTDIFIGASAE